MKRYTGQKALYEAISRSRAKAKQHSILEKLRPVLLKPETPAGQEPKPAAEPQPVVEQTLEPVVEESPQPEVAQATPEPVVELPFQAEPELEPVPEPISEMSAPVASIEPASTPRPAERVIRPASPTPVQTWRPRPVQFNEGRIEVSIPYHIGAIAALVFLVVVLVAYRLGQAGNGPAVDNAGGQAQAGVTASGTTPSQRVQTPPQNTATPTVAQTPVDTSPAPVDVRQDAPPTRRQGDHCIVLAQYRTKEDFEPVVQHFAEHGIRLVSLPINLMRRVFVEQGLNPGVLPSGDGFLLVTNDYYTNTDVLKMKQRIAEVGKLYKGKAPAGRESFAPNYFSDAYPMKIR